MSDMLTDLYRLGNLALGTTAIIFGCYSIRRRWRTWSTRTRVGVEALLAFNAATAVGAIEGIAQHNPAGIHTLLITVALIWANLALYPFWQPHHDKPWRSP